jgi:large subunit ribosomal protein L6
MSRIGKLPVTLIQGVEAKLEDNTITIKGPKGELSFDFGYKVGVKINDNQEIIVEQKELTKQGKSMWGTARARINNMVVGVTEGFEKKLELHGVGYKMAVQGDKLNLNLGFSHPINKDIPKELTLEIEKETLIIKGIDKQLVGEFAAETRSFRKVEPYKGKGFRYSDEQVIKKEGKRAVGGEG